MAYTSSPKQQVAFGGNLCGDPPTDRAIETVAMRSARNADLGRVLNARLADIRSRLFGETEAPEKTDGQIELTPAITWSLNRANAELESALNQVDRILSEI